VVGDHRYTLRAVPVVADRFDGAAFHSFFAQTFFVWRLRLLVNIGVAAIIVPFEVRGSRLTAQIAVDALIIDIEFARYVLGVFVRCVGHVSLKVKRNVRKGSQRNNLPANWCRRNRNVPLARISSNVNGLT